MISLKSIRNYIPSKLKIRMLNPMLGIAIVAYISTLIAPPIASLFVGSDCRFCFRPAWPPNHNYNGGDSSDPFDDPFDETYKPKTKSEQKMLEQLKIEQKNTLLGYLGDNNIILLTPWAKKRPASTPSASYLTPPLIDTFPKRSLAIGKKLGLYVYFYVPRTIKQSGAAPISRRVSGHLTSLR